ncbi:hypothetical protein GBA52_020960 [Prunus armeniaca]|nr:hypothetical protein GBA52_020960 [Prunus armeniaca]
MPACATGRDLAGFGRSSSSFDFVQVEAVKLSLVVLLKISVPCIMLRVSRVGLGFGEKKIDSCNYE